MEVEGFGGKEARIRISGDEIERLAEVAILGGEEELGTSLEALKNRMDASTEGGRLSILRPAPRSRVTLGSMLDPEETREFIEEVRTNRPPGLRKQTIRRIRQGRR